jgi:phospholipid-transporting ATPase
MGAVQASDYALPEFRMLRRLLLVHGRWNYIRISEMILYFFYKNMLFTIPQWITAFFAGYSGQTLYDDVYVTFYNLIFTALPLIFRAVLEQDVNYMFKVKPEYGEFPQPAGKNMT